MFLHFANLTNKIIRIEHSFIFFMKNYWYCHIKIAASIFLVMTSLCFPAHADSLTIGAGTHYVNTPYKKYNNHGEFMPVITYDSDRFYIDDSVAGVYIVKNNSHEFDVGIGITDREFNNDHASGVMRKLRTRKITSMASLNYQYKTNYGNFFTSIAADILDRHNGFTADASYEAPFQIGRMGVAIRGGFQWQSSKYNKYYYGISREESQYSGISSYNPDSTVSPYINATATYSITKNWGIFLTSRYERMPSEIKNSPMVSRSGNLVIDSGIIYSF